MIIDKFSYDFVQELNILRTNPKSYIPNIQEEKKYLQGNILKLPGQEPGFKTVEGISAYNECINFLENANSVSEIQMNKSLLNIANEYLRAIQNVKLNQIKTIDIHKFVKKYGNFEGDFNKSLEFGGINAINVLNNLVIGDGDPNRGHRNTIFNPSFNLIGVASGNHPEFGTLTVIVLCTNFVSYNKQDDAPLYIQEKTVNVGNSYNSNFNSLSGSFNNVNNSLNVSGSLLKSKKNFHNINNSVKEFPATVQYNNANLLNKNNNDEDDLNVEPGVKKINKTEVIKDINGIKYKITKKIKTMEDGSTETETYKERIDY
jgi:hypothetical protein